MKYAIIKFRDGWDQQEVTLGDISVVSIGMDMCSAEDVCDVLERAEERNRRAAERREAARPKPKPGTFADGTRTPWFYDIVEDRSGG